jgi:type I restriction enzyme S subunit
MSFNFVPFGSLYAEPVRNGLTRPTSVRGDGYRMVNMGELFAYDRIGEQEMERVQLNERELQVATLEEGDLLFARSSLKVEGTGKCSFVQSMPEVTTFESHLIRARLDRTKADPRFYFYFFQSYHGRATVLSIAKQVGAAGLPGSKLAGLGVPQPVLTIQSRIAEILAAYDNLIENNRRRMALLEDSARQLYREWFVRLRFTGHEHTRITNGVPVGWERMLLGDRVVLNYGKALKAEDRADGLVPVYGSSGIVGTHEKALTAAPGIVVGRKGNVGSVYWCSKDYWPIDTVFFVDTDTSNLWLYYAFQHMHFMSTDGAVPGLNRDFAYSRPLLIPEPRIVRDFLETAGPLHEQIGKLNEANDKLRVGRDLLLPRLMSGEISV